MADYLFDGNGDAWEPEEYLEYFGVRGVSGPGDQFTSSGPHGESSLQAQAKDHGSDESDIAIEGAVSNAVDAVLQNIGDDQGQFQHDTFVGPGPIPSGGGGGPISSGPIPGGTSLPSSATSKLSLPVILGVAAGILFFFAKK